MRRGHFLLAPFSISQQVDGRGAESLDNSPTIRVHCALIPSELTQSSSVRRVISQRQHLLFLTSGSSPLSHGQSTLHLHTPRPRPLADWHQIGIGAASGAFERSVQPVLSPEATLSLHAARTSASYRDLIEGGGVKESDITCR